MDGGVSGIEAGELMEIAVRKLTIERPEIVAEITIEVEAAVSGHSISRTIVAGEVVAGQETCRGP
jgi:hypothetical protein